MQINMKFEMPDDKDEYTLVYNAYRYWGALWEFDSFMRATYNEKNNVYQLDKDKAIDSICNKWFETLEDNYVSLDEIS
jgi:hypothetical protein